MKNKTVFFISAAFSFSLAASLLEGDVYKGAPLVCLLALMFRQLPKRFPFTMLSAAVVFFSLYFLAHMLFFNPRYRPAGIYQPLYLLLSFIIFSCLEKETIKRTFKYVTFVWLLLSFWGLIQHFTGSLYIVPQGTRANAIFYTPNTFATGINLFLLSFIALYLLGVNTRLTYGLSMFFFSGLMATQSRGGYLGLIFGMLFLALFNFIGQKQSGGNHARWTKLALGFAVVILIFQFSPGWSGDRVMPTIMEEQASDRLVLYSVAWKLIKENPWWGVGNFNFNLLFNIYKTPPFLDSTTNFVHNDYLQFWLENGIVGLLALLAIIVSFYFSVFKMRGGILKQSSPVIIMAGGAVTSIFAHAVVDFPLYIPALLVITGAFLGAANRELTDMRIAQFQLPQNELLGKIELGLNRAGLRTSFLRRVTVSLIILWLTMPMMADVAADIGLGRLLKGDVRGGIFWHSIARSMEPQNAVYYWREGIIWRDQVAILENPDAAKKAAKKADELFFAGINVNPYYDVQNLMERIRLHRDHYNLLEKPATSEELKQWAERLRSRDPHSGVVRVEYARTLAFTGKKAEAIKIAKDLQVKNPESHVVKNLINDLEQGRY